MRKRLPPLALTGFFDLIRNKKVANYPIISQNREMNIKSLYLSKPQFLYLQNEWLWRLHELVHLKGFTWTQYSINGRYFCLKNDFLFLTWSPAPVLPGLSCSLAQAPWLPAGTHVPTAFPTASFYLAPWPSPKPPLHCLSTRGPHQGRFAAPGNIW